MSSKVSSFRAFFSLVILTALDGCTTLQEPGDSPEFSPEKTTTQAKRERGLQSAWRGKSYEALIGNFGSPQIVMDVPGNNPMRTSIAIFGAKDRTSGCIDAFTLVVLRSGETVVADYFCR